MTRSNLILDVVTKELRDELDKILIMMARKVTDSKEYEQEKANLEFIIHSDGINALYSNVS